MNKILLLIVCVVLFSNLSKAQSLDTFYKNRKIGIFYAHQYTTAILSRQEIITGSHGPDEILHNFFYPAIGLYNTRKHGFFFKYENMFIGDGISILYNQRFSTHTKPHFGIHEGNDNIYTNIFGQVSFGINTYVSRNKRLILRTGLEVTDYAAEYYDLQTGIFLGIDKMITRQTMLRLNTSLSHEFFNIGSYDPELTQVPRITSSIHIQPEIIHKSGFYLGSDFRSYSGYRRVALKFGYRIAINRIKDNA